MSTTIIWSAVLADSEAACVSRQTTQIIAFAPPAPQDAAATALKWWLEEPMPHASSWNHWDAEFDEDTNEARAFVIIHEPADMAGVFEVELERPIVAKGYAAETDAAAKALAIVNREPSQVTA